MSEPRTDTADWPSTAARPTEIEPGVSGPPTPSARRRLPGIGLGLALFWLTVIVLAALLADVLPLADPDRAVGPPNVPPFTTSTAILGTDSIGRPVLPRLVYGARISLTVGLGATLLAALLGGLLGLLAAYLRGGTERVLGLFSDAVLAFPPLLVLLAIATVITPGVGTLVVSLGLLFTPPFMRITKAKALTEMSRDYILAARVLGAANARMLARELTPNSVGPVAAYSVVVIATVIVIEGSLSFLGVGIPPPAPSWGSMIAAGKDALYTAPYLVALPCLTIFLTVFSLNILGDHVQRWLGGGRRR
jgi:peptide/nickel transport system permease protein